MAAVFNLSFLGNVLLFYRIPQFINYSACCVSLVTNKMTEEGPIGRLKCNLEQCICLICLHVYVYGSIITQHSRLSPYSIIDIT